MIFGPAYSLSWSTALLRTLCKTDTKEKQRVGGRKERKYLAEGRHKLPEPAWMSCHRQCIPAWTEQAGSLKEVTGMAGESRKTGK